MTRIAEVLRIHSPAKAWRIRFEGEAFGYWQPYPGRLPVIELVDGQLTRADVFADGATASFAFDASGVLPPSRDGLHFLPVGTDAVCAVFNGELWLWRGSGHERVNFDGRRVHVAIGSSDLGVEVSAISEVDTAYHRYKLTSAGVLDRGPSPALGPLADRFDFRDLEIELCQRSEFLHPCWSVALRRPHRRTRWVGELVEMWWTLWFDGWLVGQDDVRRRWAAPITRDSAVDGLLFSTVPALSLRMGLEIVPGARAAIRRASASLGEDFTGWGLVPFSRYSTKTAEKGEEHKKVQWTCLDSAKTGIWTFEYPKGSRIMLDPEPL